MKLTDHSGTTYDTDKASIVGKLKNRQETGSFTSYDAWIYKAPRSKRYFLYGKGGPLSIFGLVAGKGRSFRQGGRVSTEEELEATIGEAIFPLTDMSAFKILIYEVNTQSAFAEFGTREGFKDLFTEEEKEACKN